MRVEGLLFDVPISEREPDLEVLARTRLPGVRQHMPGHKPTLEEQIAGLRDYTFAGELQLDLYHAALVVHLRRNVSRELAYRRFEVLWDRWSEQLLQSLDTRWLVSACDTIMEHAADPAERARACVGSTLINTIKLYETERLALVVEDKPYGEVQQQFLFDGVTPFVIRRGDMIFNLRERTRSLCSGKTVASRIVLELLRRADRENTVYRRFAAVHDIEATRWA